MIQIYQNIRGFYQTSLGRVTQRILRVRLRHFWPELTGKHVLAMGYPTPYLQAYLETALRLNIVMPPNMQEVHPWPPESENHVLVADETELPYEDRMMDRILMVHCLERSGDIMAALQEAWRVLDYDGRILLVVPNRRGLWVRRDHTPFGHGVPFSQSQLRKILHEMGFTVEKMEQGLFMPPFENSFLHSMSPALERLGARFLDAFGGVYIVEASKQVFGGLPIAKAPKMRIRQKTVSAPDVSRRK